MAVTGAHGMGVALALALGLVWGVSLLASAGVGILGLWFGFRVGSVFAFPVLFLCFSSDVSVCVCGVLDASWIPDADEV